MTSRKPKPTTETVVTYHQEGAIRLLSRMLASSTRLPGAACIGQHALFDPPAEQEATPSVARRHEAAVRVCMFVCPVRSDCAAWVEGLTPRQRPGGVVAGRRPQIPRQRRSKVSAGLSS